MEYRIIAIFCLIDEFLKEIGYKDDKRAYITIYFRGLNAWYNSFI